MAESFFGTIKNDLIYRRPWLERQRGNQRSVLQSNPTTLDNRLCESSGVRGNESSRGGVINLSTFEVQRHFYSTSLNAL